MRITTERDYELALNRLADLYDARKQHSEPYNRLLRCIIAYEKRAAELFEGEPIYDDR